MYWGLAMNNDEMFQTIQKDHDTFKYTQRGIEDSLDKLDKKIDQNLVQLNSKLENIDKTLLRNTISLEEHMKRSDTLEKNFELFKGKVVPILDSFGAIKVLFAIVASLITLIHFFNLFFKLNT
jgi:hypothetical protein